MVRFAVEDTSSLVMRPKRAGFVSPEVEWFASGSADAEDASNSDRTTALAVASLRGLISYPSPFRALSVRNIITSRVYRPPGPRAAVHSPGPARAGCAPGQPPMPTNVKVKGRPV